MKALVIVTKCERGDFGTCDALLLLCRSHCAFQTVGEKNMSQISEVDVTDLASTKVRRRSWSNFGLRIAINLLAPLGFIALLEVGLRIGGVGFPTDLTVSCTVKGRPAHCYNLFFSAPFFPPGMIKTPQVFAVPVEKSKRTVRIFVLGESAAMGDPEPAYAFSRYLEVMLKDRFPETNFEVINTGIVAINSHVLVTMAEGLAPYQPDMFIIYAGNNEVVGPYGPGTALASSRLSLPVIRSSIFIRSTRIGQIAARLFGRRRQWQGMEMFLDKQVRADSDAMPLVYENFASNLNEIIAVAQRVGAHVVVSTVATNLKDCGPFASMHREGITPAALQNWSSLMQLGVQQEASNQYADALKSYSAAAAIDDEYAELEFRRGRSLLAIGDHADARQHFLRARDLDTLRFRADSQVNDIIRSVAKSKGPSVGLVDAEAILADRSTQGIIGNELLYEHVHLNPAGNYQLARAILPAVVDQLPKHLLDGTVNASVMSEEQCERLLALTGHDRARVDNEVAERLLRPPFTNRADNADQLERISAEISAIQENPEYTLEQYRWAVARRPEDTVLRRKFGLFMFPYARDAALEQLQLSQPFDGFPVLTPDGRPIE